MVRGRLPSAFEGLSLVELRRLTLTVRKMVVSLHGSRIEAAGADLDDVVQDVLMKIIEKDRSSQSRWTPSRGLSRTSYAYTVAKTAGIDSLRRHSRWAREKPKRFGLPLVTRKATRIEDPSQEIAEWVDRWDVLSEDDHVGLAMEHVYALLDLDEERTMAAHLAAGCSVAEAGRRMGLTEDGASELATRVRALLLPMREEG